MFTHSIVKELYGAKNGELMLSTLEQKFSNILVNQQGTTYKQVD